MPDSITARDKGTGFTPHAEGQFAAVCVDVVDLGQRLEQFKDKPPRLSPKCALVFLTNSAGETKDVSGEFTVSMGDRATLRAFLALWRGKSYTPEQAAAGVPLDKLVGHPALLSIEHKRSRNNNLYAKISAIAPLPKEMTAPAANGYVRGEFWAERKKAYGDEAAKFLLLQTVVKSDDDLPPQPTDEDDELPF